MRKINTVVVHSSATPPEMDIGVEDIRRWHVEERGWSDIGYHYVIRRDGTLEMGRDLALAGAHARGYNAESIGICLVGGVKTGDVSAPEDNFTEAQHKTASALLNLLVSTGMVTRGRVKDHRELDSHKDCPCLTKLARDTFLQRDAKKEVVSWV